MIKLQKKLKKEVLGDRAQAVKHLPSSNPSTALPQKKYMRQKLLSKTLTHCSATQHE
jgi:hypothetical protein